MFPKFETFYRIMAGAPAIDTRSQNSFIKQKQSKKKQKAKQTKKQKHVAVRICRFFSLLFALFSHFVRCFFAFVSLFFRFFPRRVQLCFCMFICFILLLFFHCFFHKKKKHYLMVGHVWLPSPNIIIECDILYIKTNNSFNLKNVLFRFQPRIC